MSANGEWLLTVRDSFSAAHSLRNYQGKCEAVHGHNFQVSLTVAGSELVPETEYLVDFGDLKKALKEALAPLDHCYLNEVPPFDRLNVTSENLARHIFLECRKRLERPGLRVIQVGVAETDRQEAVYREASGRLE